MLTPAEFTNQCLLGKCEDVLTAFPDKAVNLIVTSPPYAGIADKYKDGFAAPPPHLYCDWFMPKVHQFSRVLADNGSFILNIDDKVIDGFRHPYVYELVCRIVKETDFKLFERINWNKGKSLCHPKRFRNPVEHVFWFAKGKDFTFNLDEMRTPYDPVSINRMKKPIKKRFARTAENQDIVEYKDWKPHPKGALPSTLLNIGSVAKRRSDKHFAMFPEKFAAHFIKGGSNPGDLVLDPFAGAFTTCIAAKRLGRNYCGIDIFQAYIDDGMKDLAEIKPLDSAASISQSQTVLVPA
jgi:site-specific DNA-methyltransferase (cytosine-N4-specific)